MSKYRDWVNKNSPMVTIGAVLVLIAALVYIIKSQNKSTPVYKGPSRLYFYDLGSTAADPLDRLYTGKASDIPPIESPSHVLINGNFAGVRAWVFACGDCKDKSKYNIGFLEIYTQEARETIEKMSKPVPDGQLSKSYLDDPVKVEAGHLIRSLDENQWVPFSSKAGNAIKESGPAKCSDPAQKSVVCFPPDNEK